MIRPIRKPTLVAAMVLLAAPAISSGQHSQSTSEQGAHGHGHGHSHGEHEAEAPEDGATRHPTMEHDFRDAEKWSKRFDSPERMVWQKPGEVAELMAIEPGMTVVDLGAGTGYFLPYLSRAVGARGFVLALDPEVDMIRFISERVEREGLDNVEARQIPYDDPELEAGSVDRMLIVNTWHHIEERTDYAKKLLAALRPGGRVYVVDFTRDSPSGPPVEERLDPKQVIDELAGGGLEAGLVEESLPRQYVVVGRGAPRSEADGLDRPPH